MCQVSQKGVVDLSLNMTTHFRKAAPAAHCDRAHDCDGWARWVIWRHDNCSLQRAAAAADNTLEANARAAAGGDKTQGLRDVVVEVLVQLGGVCCAEALQAYGLRPHCVSSDGPQQRFHLAAGQDVTALEFGTLAQTGREGGWGSLV